MWLMAFSAGAADGNLAQPPAHGFAVLCRAVAESPACAEQVCGAQERIPAALKEGTCERQERDEHPDRISRQADERGFADVSESKRFARLDEETP